MKQISRVVIMLSGLLMVSCSKETKVPENTIPEEKMVLILTDIHLVEARVSRVSVISIDSSTLITEKLKKDIFKRYQTDTAAYNRSYKFYSTHPEFMEQIYEKVVKNIQKKVDKNNYKGL